MKLSECVAIITGGGAGFGRAFAERICEAGGRVLLTDINETIGKATCKALASQYGADHVMFVVQNVTDMSSFDALFDLAYDTFHCHVNVMVNNAGISGDGAFWSEELSLSWKDVIEIDLNAVIRGTQIAISKMKETGGGAIINIASMAGVLPVPQVPSYAAAKSGVVAFSRSCAMVTSEWNIRINSLCPTFSNTAMGQKAMNDPTIAMAIELMGGLLPIEKVVDALVQVLQDDSVNGETIRVNAAGTKYHSFGRASSKL